MKFPLTLVGVAAYATVAMLGIELSTEVAVVPLPSGMGLRLNVGGLLIVLTWTTFVAETWRGVNARPTVMINHLLSLLVAMIALGLLVFVEPFGNATFLLIVAILFTDAILGTMISMTVARGNVWVG